VLVQAVRDAWESGDPTQVRLQLASGADPASANEQGPKNDHNSCCGP
jgi:hypothetical protein